MIVFRQKGNFQKLEKFLRKSTQITKFKNIDIIAEECIRLLSEATPKDTGVTSNSWGYEIIYENKKRTLIIHNTNILEGINIAFLIDIGHATENGIWIEGVNYIEPVVRETYNQILNNTWEELKKL